MAQKRYCEEVGIIYSAWHRSASIERFMSKATARVLSMIDIDYPMIWVEYEDESKEMWPVGLIETARDVGKNKTFTVTRNLAVLSGLPGMCVLYMASDNLNPADQNIQDIDQFRVKRLNPELDKSWRIFTPIQYANLLLNMRSVGIEMLHKRLLELF